MAWPFLLTLLSSCLVTLCPARGAALDSAADFDRQIDRYPVVDEIDSATVAPMHEFPPGVSSVTNILGVQARVLANGDEARGMAWVIGKGKGLTPGQAYVLSFEFPDDVPRSIFIANRGADTVRGFATSHATGDVRQQYTQPSLESLSYPQSGDWQRYRTVFVLHHRFQGLKAQRDPKPGGRPFTPADGFHVIMFQSRRINDPRSHGVAIGRIRLHAVPDLAALAPMASPLPDDLPQRHVFFREEMGDEPVSGKAPEDRACADPVDWYVAKARVSRALGFRTFTRDLLEFGHNQGWQSGDQNWIVNAQPPLTDLWDRLVPRIAAEGMDLLPYYEYKGGLGLSSARPVSLGWQRRAEKLYHGQLNTNYTGVWWVEQHNADLTDPDTLADAKRVLAATILRHTNQARFAGVWFRTRGNHLPVSFADGALQRFRDALANDQIAGQATNRAALIASYEGDRKLYDLYLRWWLDQRARFLTALQTHVASAAGSRARLLFTPWTSEPVPLLRNPETGPAGHPIQITTDDPAWWDAFARSQSNSSWFRWAYVPTSFDKVVQDNIYQYSLRFREPVSPLPWRSEDFHAAPGGDPERYRDHTGVMLTYPFGRLFTVARADLLEEYRSAAGLTLVRHFTLNEDNPDDKSGKGPFGGEVGYACVDVDRAGSFALLAEARAVAAADPVNIGYLCGSVHSSGFPGYVRQFNQAFLSLPALPSVRLLDAASDRDVVVREIRTPRSGSYFLVVNTSFQPKKGVQVRLGPGGTQTDLLTGRGLNASSLRLDLYPGELRTFRSD